MNLALFYVWEDARIWAHLNHSFDRHLSYLGPVILFFSILNPRRVHIRELQWLMDWSSQHPFFTDMAGDIFCPQVRQT